MTAYYNEIDKAAAHVLECLIKDRHIASGVVDTRSIADVQPSDLRGFTQIHLFAGAGIWSVAARMAGWPDDRPLFSGSCPCQPFSAAGKKLGTDDPRHLWPHMFRLVRAVRPAVVVGEQVAGAAGYGWFDGVRTDLEGEDYACRAVDLPACSLNAPHIRHRLFWCGVADAHESERGWRASDGRGVLNGTHAGWQEDQRDAAGRREARDDMADAARPGVERNAGEFLAPEQRDCRQPSEGSERDSAVRSSGSNYWSDAVWLDGADGKSRRVKPGLCLMVDGMAGRSHALRVIGNSIVPQVAAEVLKALMDTL